MSSTGSSWSRFARQSPRPSRPGSPRPRRPPRPWTGQWWSDRVASFSRVRLLALALAAVVLIPAAGAGSGAFLTLNQLSNHADPSVLRVNGGVLVAYDVESTGTVNVIDTGATTHTVV